MNDNTTNAPSHDQGRQGCECPLCALVGMVDCARKRHGSFFHHLGNAEMELLRAFRSLIDWRISAIESRCDSDAHRNRATRIEVE